MSSLIFEKVAPENLAIFIKMALKPRFYDSSQPQNHTEEKEKKRKRAEAKKKGLVISSLFFLAI